jgi:hypothetical protein
MGSNRAISDSPCWGWGFQPGPLAAIDRIQSVMVPGIASLLIWVAAALPHPAASAANVFWNLSATPAGAGTSPSSNSTVPTGPNGAWAAGEHPNGASSSGASVACSYQGIFAGSGASGGPNINATASNAAASAGGNITDTITNRGDQPVIVVLETLVNAFGTSQRSGSVSGRGSGLANYSISPGNGATLRTGSSGGGYQVTSIDGARTVLGQEGWFLSSYLVPPSGRLTLQLTANTASSGGGSGTSSSGSGSGRAMISVRIIDVADVAGSALAQTTASAILVSESGRDYVRSTAVEFESWKIVHFPLPPEKRPGDDEDSDGDGWTNREEFLCFTDPLDPVSALRLGIEIAGGKVRLRPNRTHGLARYTIRRSDSGLAPLDFVEALRFDPASSNSPEVFELPLTPGVPASFYRVTVGERGTD